MRPGPSCLSSRKDGTDPIKSLHLPFVQPAIGRRGTTSRVGATRPTASYSVARAWSDPRSFRCEGESCPIYRGTSKQSNQLITTGRCEVRSSVPHLLDITGLPIPGTKRKPSFALTSPSALLSRPTLMTGPPSLSAQVRPPCSCLSSGRIAYGRSLGRGATRRTAATLC